MGLGQQSRSTAVPFCLWVPSLSFLGSRLSLKGSHSERGAAVLMNDDGDAGYHPALHILFLESRLSVAIVTSDSLCL